MLSIDSVGLKFSPRVHVTKTQVRLPGGGTVFVGVMVAVDVRLGDAVTVGVRLGVLVGVRVGVTDKGTGVRVTVADGGIGVGGTLVEVTGRDASGCVQSVYPTVLPLPTGYDTEQSSNP